MLGGDDAVPDRLVAVLEAAHEERAAAAGCAAKFNATRFDTGFERQLRFVLHLCTSSVHSHGATLQPLIQWAELPAAYAALEAID